MSRQNTGNNYFNNFKMNKTLGIEKIANIIKYTARLTTSPPS